MGNKATGYDTWILDCLFPAPAGATPCPTPSGGDFDFTGSGPNLVGNIVGIGEKAGVYWALIQIPALFFGRQPSGRGVLPAKCGERRRMVRTSTFLLMTSSEPPINWFQTVQPLLGDHGQPSMQQLERSSGKQQILSVEHWIRVV
jgi:hypothetical protein